MDKEQFLLKLLLLGFEKKSVNHSLALYKYQQSISVDFFLLRNGTEVVRLYSHARNYVLSTSIDANYEKIFNYVLKELGITNDHVQGKFKKKDSS